MFRTKKSAQDIYDKGMGGRNTLQKIVYAFKIAQKGTYFNLMRVIRGKKKGRIFTTEVTEFHGGRIEVVTELVEVT